MKNVFFWASEIVAFAFAASIFVGIKDISAEEKYYDSLSNEQKLQYVLNTYYEPLNEFLDIADCDKIARQNIEIKEPEHSQAIGCYVVESNKIMISTKALTNLGETVEVLAHEMNHHKQALSNVEELKAKYLDRYAGQDGYDLLPTELESERVGHLFVIEMGLDYYNGRGMSPIEYDFKSILATAKRGAQYGMDTLYGKR